MSRSRLLAAALAAVAAFSLAGCITPPTPSASEPAASEPAATEPAASEPAAEPEASEPAASEPAAESADSGDFCDNFNAMFEQASEATTALMDTVKVGVDADGNITMDGTPNWDSFNPLIEQVVTVAQAAAAAAPADYKSAMDAMADSYVKLRDAGATKDVAKFREAYTSMATEEYMAAASKLTEIAATCAD
jgi:hypothetical protein